MSYKKGAAAEGLPENKRYIATHSSDGKSVYLDSPPQRFNDAPGVGGVARSYSLASLPATIGDASDIKAYLSEDGPTSYTGRNIVSQLPTGANLLVIDLAPGAKSAMHRTVSVDFSICVMGEIEHELDGGEKVRLRPGVGLRAFLAVQALDVAADGMIMTGPHSSARHESPLVKSIEGYAGTICCCYAAGGAVRDCRARGVEGGAYSQR